MKQQSNEAVKQLPVVDGVIIEWCRLLSKRGR